MVKVGQYNGASGWPVLRAQGLSLIQTMNRERMQWTDYNAHDPGITLLEILCYAISDLSYRLNFSIEDLFAANPAKHNGIVQQFYLALQTLPNAPLTTNDYRCLLAQWPEIKNAWLDSRDKRGRSRVFIYGPTTLNSNEVVSFQKNILDNLRTQENLCESFDSVTLIKEKVNLSVNVIIVLNDRVDAEAIKTEVTLRLTNFFSQTLTKNTFNEMEARGSSLSDILQGPILEHGFVQQEELERTRVRFCESSFGPIFTFSQKKLISILKNIDGVRTVSLTNFGGSTSEELYVATGVPCFNATDSKLTLFQYNAWRIFNLKSLPIAQLDTVDGALEIQYPEGRFRELSNYTSIQEQLPSCYGVGSEGLPADTDGLRKAQAKQLRGYLMLFDQTLTDYFAQLDAFKTQFAMKTGEDSQEELAQAYFFQKLPDVAWKANFSDMYDIHLSVEEKGLVFQRNFKQKNKLLDHLLALFSETYIPRNIYIKIINAKNGSVYDESMDTKYLSDKRKYLNAIVELRGNRGLKLSLDQLIALKLVIDPGEVSIIDYPTPPAIPNNVIPFLVAHNDDFYDFRLTITLPSIFVNSAEEPDDELQTYAKLVLLVLLPAHITFELNS